MVSLTIADISAGLLFSGELLLIGGIVYDCITSRTFDMYKLSSICIFSGSTVALAGSYYDFRKTLSKQVTVEEQTQTRQEQEMTDTK